MLAILVATLGRIENFRLYRKPKKIHLWDWDNTGFLSLTEIYWQLENLQNPDLLENQIYIAFMGNGWILNREY